MLCHVTLSLSPLASSFFMKTFDPSFHDFFWLLGGMKKARRNVPMTTSTFLFLVFFATVENSHFTLPSYLDSISTENQFPAAFLKEFEVRGSIAKENETFLVVA